MTILSRAQIAAMHPDEEWRERLVRIAQLSDLLGSCVIGSDYRVPDLLNNAIALTPEGTRILTEAAGKKKIPAKDAKLMCLLDLFHQDLLVDVANTDIEVIEQSISRQLQDRKILFAPVLGRALYDRAADLFEDLERYLTVSQTFELLEGMPQGVAQFGQYLAGPRGLLRLGFNRSFADSRYRIPLFHCSDPSCILVHSCSLSTDWDAPINDMRSEFRRIVTRDGRDQSEYAEFINDLVDDEPSRFDDLDLATLPYVLGDAFTEQELRHSLVYILNGSNGELFRERLRSMGLKNVGSASSVAEKPSYYELLQLYLSLPNRELVQLLDDCIINGAISIPNSEVRQAVVSRQHRSEGPFGSQVEFSSLGHRVSAATSVASERLVRLIQEVYPVDTVEQEEELEWQLREVEGPTVQSRLEEFLRTGSPETVLNTLVLCKRSNVVIASHKLGVDDRYRTDGQLIQAFLWKLGFNKRSVEPERSNFWRTHERVEQLTQTATSSGFVNYDDLRGLCGTYFPELEGILLDSLLYSTWALLFDHFNSDAPFTFVPEIHRSWAMNELNKQLLTDLSAEDEVVPFEEDKVTLAPLIEGFGVLARRLQDVASHRDDYLRDASARPAFEKYTSLQSFPFGHTAPVLDLLGASAQKLIEVLLDVRKDLAAAEVATVRNEQAHYRRQRSVTSIARLSNALAIIRLSLEKLEQVGCARVEFSRTAVTSDAWGRRTHFLSDDSGRQYALRTPSQFDWVRLPSLAVPQYVMVGATLREPNEVLRFRVQPASGYSQLWANYPRRRRHRAPIADIPARQEPRVSHSEPHDGSAS